MSIPKSKTSSKTRSKMSKSKSHRSKSHKKTYRSTHSMGSMIHLHPKGEPTVHGVYHWFKHIFEHLGWMILAKEYGYHDKLLAYKNSINRLIEAIELRIPKLADKDNRKDFEIMRNDLMILKKHVEKDKL